MYINMVHTRNNNTPGDYYEQQKSYKQSLDYNQYKYSQSGRAYHNALPCMGITPSHMPRDIFSQNLGNGAFLNHIIRHLLLILHITQIRLYPLVLLGHLCLVVNEAIMKLV